MQKDLQVNPKKKKLRKEMLNNLQVKVKKVKKEKKKSKPKKKPKKKEDLKNKD